MLKKFPSQYIYEPWKAPRSVQQAAGCIIGKDYPQPIVQHEVISKKNIQRMKMAYAKRPSASAESPTKKQGNVKSLGCVVQLLEKSSVILMSQNNFFLNFPGVKRKSLSIVDMMKKQRKTS